MQTIITPNTDTFYAVRTNTILIFAIGKEPIKYIGKYNASYDRETDMMASR